ncbi:PBS lyase HEAT-like repeat domain protein [Leptolyngbya sp. NIES-3755]|nr:PBS lyase HEAT-like repeat domain protein [Leptolyngbya sp. NIES-3755]
MFSQFQPYLESIRTTYEKWRERYTLTDAVGKQQRSKEASPFFEFNLMVQTVKREERERQEEKIERFSVLDGLRKYANQQVLLVGRPGSGKSTALARLMLEEATNPQMGIPVLVELRYWQGSIEQLIRDSFNRHGLAIEQLEEVLLRSLILFDGVNELPSEEARSQLSAFRRNHPKLPMIFTTRDLSLGGDLGIEKKLEMQPLTEQQMRDFIRAYVPEQADQMLRQLNDRLREFGQTPLLLWMLCEVIQQSPNSELPKNLGEIFRVFTEAYEQSSVRKHEVAALKGDVKPLSDRRLWKKALKALAFLMMQGETPVDFRVVIDRDEAERELNRIFPNEPFPVRDILDDLLKYHLLQNRGAAQIEFRHQLIQEYYAAEALLNRVDRLEGEQLKREYLNFLKWTEPVALMLALVEDEVLTESMVKLALEVDQRLGARLAGEVKPELQTRTIEFVEALEIPIWLKIEFLEVTRSNIAINSLLKLVEDSDPDLRRRVAWALARTSTEQAVDVWLKLLEDFDFITREIAARQLGDIGTEQAVEGLFKLSDSPDPDARRSASRGLSIVGSERAIEGLLKLSRDSNPNVRRSAAWALGDIDTEQAIEGLLKLVQDPDPTVREVVAWVLGDIDAEQAVGDLLIVETPDKIESAALVLGDISTEQAVEDVFNLVRDPDPDVRADTAWRLGEIGTEQAVDSLLKLVKDSDSDVRRSAAWALGKINAGRAAGSLLKLVEDPDSDVREDAAWVLEEIVKKHANMLAHHLPHLLTLIPTESGKKVRSVIFNVQANCKYYNYEIYQDYLKAQKDDRQTPQNHDRPNMNSPSQSSLTLFFSYSHKDEALRDKLATHLSQLKNENIITDWHDRDITAGTDWAEAINTNLNTADIILLLISADFIASEYCREIEMERALERYKADAACVIPIILRPCNWETAPFGKLQGLPTIRGGGIRPVTKWKNQDEAFTAIAKDIRKAAAKIRQKKSSG